MAVLPAYKDVLKLGRERPDEILLDLGACCELSTKLSVRTRALTPREMSVGVDARKAAADGYPLRNIVTTDLQQGESDDTVSR